MKKRFSVFNFKEAFQPDSGFKFFLLSVLITGLSYGLYKGIMDNFLSEIVGMGEMDRGITEFFRELPGVLLVFILAALYMLSAESMYKIGAVVMLIGMGMHAILPPTKVLATLSLCIYSLGEHVQLGMKSTLTLKYSQPGKGGAALGVQGAVNQVGTLVSYLVIVVAFSVLSGAKAYNAFFWISAALAAVSMVFALRISGRSAPDKSKSRFYFRKKYFKYYMLEMFYGSRKQVFLTFGPYVLIRFYGAGASTISLLFAISAVMCFFTAPLVGRIIDKLGYKTVMVSDTLILVIVCFCYGFAHHILPMNVAFIVCCVNYILDAVISQASMAANLYVRDLSDSEEEVKATISTGVSINHLISVLIALFGGWIWQTLGMSLLFIISAFLGLCNSAYAATIKKSEMKSVS